MALGGQIVDLVRLHLLHDADEVPGVGKVAVMQHEPAVLLMRPLIQMIDAVGIEERGTPLDAVYLVALVQEEFGQIGPVLPRDAGDERFFHDVVSVVLFGDAARSAARFPPRGPCFSLCPACPPHDT